MTLFVASSSVPRARSLGSMLAAMLASLTLSLVVAPAVAASVRRKDFPCPGCITDLPPLVDGKRAPMLVVLHGDTQGPAPIAATWAKEAEKRGVILFAPKCPKADGCNAQSQWWAWALSDEGDPAWFDARFDAIDAERPIDRDRIWLAGWSGGSSYIGAVAPALAGRFAAVNVSGGGMPPSRPTCPIRCQLPVYFMVGDLNPLHALARDLRVWFDGCGQEVVWDLQPKKDHAGEWLALNAPGKVVTIFDWLEAHPRACVDPALDAGRDALVDDATEAMDGGASDPSVTPSSDATPATLPTAIPPAPSRCGCAVERGESDTAPWLVVAAIVLGSLRRHRAPRRRSLRATQPG